MGSERRSVPMPLGGATTDENRQLGVAQTRFGSAAFRPQTTESPQNPKETVRYKFYFQESRSAHRRAVNDQEIKYKMIVLDDEDDFQSSPTAQPCSPLHFCRVLASTSGRFPELPVYCR